MGETVRIRADDGSALDADEAEPSGASQGNIAKRGDRRVRALALFN